MACTSNINWSTFTTNTCYSTPWSIQEDGKLISYIITDSIDCGGICDEVQTGEASAVINVGSSTVFFSLSLNGLVQAQTQGSDRVLVYLNNELIISGDSLGGNYGCTNTSMNVNYLKRQPFVLQPNTQHNVDVSFSSIEAQNHQGCFFSLSATTECVEASPTPTPTVTPTQKPCRGAGCWCGKNCETPTPTPTLTETPQVTPSNTATPSYTPTSTVTPSECYGCTLWSVNVIQGDLDSSPDGKVYVDYVSCNTTTSTRVSYSYPGLYQEALCVNLCYTPSICLGYNPTCISPVSGSSITNTGKDCKIIDPNCDEIFTLYINEPGYTEFFDLVDLGQNYGNVEVTISATNFNQISEIFVGNLENKYGDSFIFSRGQSTQTKTVGFLTFRNKTFLDISVYMEGSPEFPFQPVAITFNVVCPTTIPCIEPSSTPTPTSTVTQSVTPTITPTAEPTATPTRTSETPTPTPTTTNTPTVSEPYCCYQYEITNYYNTTQTIFYNLCDGTPTSINVLGNGEGFTLCAQKNSVTFGGNICDGSFVDCIIITRASFSCNACEVTPTPTPTVTATPTKTSITPTPTATPTPTNDNFNCTTCVGGGWVTYDNDECYRVLTTTVIPPSPPLTLLKSSYRAWSIYGTQFFAKGYNKNGKGTVQAQLTAPQFGGSYTNPLWSNPNLSYTEGPLNRCARWQTNTGESQPPFNTWVGFTVCLSGIAATKTYYAGIAADNDYRLVLDGVEILNTRGNGWTDEQFKWWHVYPIEIGAGDHILSLYGISYQLLSGFGCEIYDNTLQELTAATSYSQLNVIYTSSGQTQATVVQNPNGLDLNGGYRCATQGYNYSTCTGQCTKYEFCKRVPDATPSPTPTLTPTKRALINCPPGVNYTWKLIRVDRKGKAVVADSGDVVPVQTASNGEIIQARLNGLSNFYIVLSFFKRYTYTLATYDCNGNLCCIIYTIDFPNLQAPQYTLFFDSNLISVDTIQTGKINRSFCNPPPPGPYNPANYQCAKFTVTPWVLPPFIKF